MNYKILLLADMHFGAINLQRFRSELDSCLFNKFKEFEYLDYIIIAGDLFDTKEQVSSPVFESVYKFILDLYRYSESDFKYNKLPTIILVEGTTSHDNYQLNILGEIFADKGFPINVINKVTTLKTLYPDEDFDILFLPTEYMTDKDEYYKEYFSNEYDLIIGHGMVDKIHYASEDKKGILSTPVFSVDKLLSICKKCYFGHIHNRLTYNKNFHYIGPTTKWEFGKDKEKPGYYLLEIDTDKGEIMETYIENENAQVLPSVILTIDENMTLEELNEILTEYIDHTKSNENVTRVRLIVDIDSSLDMHDEMKDFIISKYGSDNNVHLIINIIQSEKGNNDNNESSENNNENDEGNDRHNSSYITDESLSDAAKISRFIAKNSGKTISEKKIMEFLDILSDNDA